MDAAGQHVVGVFGGSGFYHLLDEVEEVALDTPYGPPSARVRIGEIEGTRVPLMPRHGDEHTLPPHRINYRANVWAMKQVGVRRILGPSACGSLNPELEPGTFVHLRPVRGPHPGPRGHLLRRATNHSRLRAGPRARALLGDDLPHHRLRRRRRGRASGLRRRGVRGLRGEPR